MSSVHTLTEDQIVAIDGKHFVDPITVKIELTNSNKYSLLRYKNPNQYFIIFSNIVFYDVKDSAFLLFLNKYRELQ